MNGKKPSGPAGRFAGVKWAYAGISLFLIVLGIFAVARPDIGINAVCIAIGAASVVFGMIKIAVYFMREVKGIALIADGLQNLCLVVFSAAAAKALAKAHGGDPIGTSGAGDASPPEAAKDAPEESVRPARETVIDEEGSYRS